MAAIMQTGASPFEGFSVIISLFNEIMTFHDNNNFPSLKDGRE